MKRLKRKLTGNGKIKFTFIPVGICGIKNPIKPRRRASAPPHCPVLYIRKPKVSNPTPASDDKISGERVASEIDLIKTIGNPIPNIM